MNHSRTTLAVITAKTVLGSTLALGLLLTPHATAHADETVNLSELPTIDSMPVCGQEDGSDIDTALLPCVWTDTDTGNDWLTYADRSFLIVDDTTHTGNGALPGPVTP